MEEAKCTRSDCLIRGGKTCVCGRYTSFVAHLGWALRDDGDIQTHQGVVPLEEFAAAGRIDGVQLSIARDVKRLYLERRQAK